MSTPTGRQRTAAFFGLTDVVFRFVVVQVCFLLAAAPTFAAIVLLDRSAGNIPYYALALVPLAPAWSATLAAMRARDDEVGPWVHFWRAWRGNVRDVLALWVPALAVGAVLAYNVAFAVPAGVGVAFVVAGAVMLAVLTLWASHVVMIASLFRFRTRDTARLAAYFLAAAPLATLAALAHLVVAAGIVAFTSDWVLALAAVVFAAFALAGARPMIDDIERRFIARDDGATR